jgi:hypothetical protein
MSMRWLLVIGGLVLGLASIRAAQAEAAVPATPEQTGAMVTVVAGETLSPITTQIYGTSPVSVEDLRFGSVDPNWGAAMVVIAFPSLTGDATWRARRDRIYSPTAESGLGIFHRDPAGEWSLEEPPDPTCGAGADLSIPIAVQYDLELPNCGLAGAHLGDPVALRDSSGGWRGEPGSISLAYPDGERVRLVDLGHWTRWGANRGADAETYGEVERRLCNPTCGRPGKRHLAVIHAHGYQRCGGYLSFRRVEWLGMDAETAGKRRRFLLPCP